ncbi:MAG: metal-dependent hydrolase [Candidatus Melainabacteria bacterium RIFOXYA12_FULL_32_12]|nr:MAG: metal-dependent hydrolase [Candidatus Melainabacteria bacterium RIFOXYA12_FULL_32_12]
MKKFKDITYSLKQSKRKTMSIYVERDGAVSVLAPDELSVPEIEQVIASKKYWIHKQKAELELLNLSKVEREFVSGESFLYLGRPYTLKVVEDLDVPLKLYQGYLHLRKSDIKRGTELFKEFYKTKGTTKIIERINLYKDMIGVNPKNIRIMELKSRWASCSERSLNFNWKVMMAPLTIIDYIVVHELTHFIHPNHTEAFWNSVDKVLPDYWERKNWLKDNGASLDLA